MIVNPASWTNGQRTITGSWYHDGITDKFYITLDVRSSEDGEFVNVIAEGDTPEWHNWKRIIPTPDCIETPRSEEQLDHHSTGSPEE